MHDPTDNRSGFSLVEVALALVIAAGGLLAIFGVFPVALRQSAMSTADTVEAAFGTSALESLAGNIARIDDIKVWNDYDKFWKRAVEGTGLEPTLHPASELNRSYKSSHREQEGQSGTTSGPFSPATVEVAKSVSADVWYAGREETASDARTEARNRVENKLILPPQYLIRLKRFRQETSDGWIRPNVYRISIVSSNLGKPQIYIREPLYSRDFYFMPRP